MNTSEMSTYKIGLFYTAGSYFLWGILPLYWKMVEHVSAEEILAHRIFWSFMFMIVLLTFKKEWKNVKTASQRIIKQPLLFFSLLLSSLLISINWFVYIWSVNHDNMIEASLGYYINPLISVLLGMIFFKEKLNLLQKVSFLIAAIGVMIMTLHYGQVPWIALTLALSFGLYGLTKKMTKLSPAIGLTFETLVVTPIAAYYLWLIFSNGKAEFLAFDISTNALLVGAGIATALPLLLFASGAQRIPLYMVGVLQYIAPTITLIIGIVLYKEPFSTIEIITFSFIWSALILFTLSNSKYLSKVEIRRTRKKSIGL
ncbi:transporter [Bacillus sp. SA1-12]|uniref:EamA family transporter RarD n=1 Tax=Bacillus sp. SA1-12 TaxID=1455638 RepID=UPI000627286D|nr:EamA family transporter RarD [Bacillus sp. SA1-12]KKI88660.1 transporter [Bacillus sp. SA1-12]